MRQKWDRKSEEGIFVGYCENTKGFCVWQPEANKVIISRDIVFREEGGDSNQVVRCAKLSESRHVNVPLNVSAPTTTNNNNNFTEPAPADDQPNNDLSGISSHFSSANTSPSSRRNSSVIEINSSDESLDDGAEESTVAHSGHGSEESLDNEAENSAIANRLRDRNEMPVPNYNPSFSFIDSLLIAETATNREPKSYADVLNAPDSDKWKDVIEEEMESLIMNETWSLVELPANRRAIGNRWVFKIKSHPDGVNERYKARLVVKGFTHKSGIDYGETR